jgi:hypothetical protein
MSSISAWISFRRYDTAGNARTGVRMPGAENTNERKTASEGEQLFTSEMGWQEAEVRSQKSEVRSQRGFIDLLASDF